MVQSMILSTRIKSRYYIPSPSHRERELANPKIDRERNARPEATLPPGFRERTKSKLVKIMIWAGVAVPICIETNDTIVGQISKPQIV